VTTGPADFSFSRIPLSQKGLLLRGLVFRPSLRVRLRMCPIIDALSFLEFVLVCAIRICRPLSPYFSWLASPLNYASTQSPLVVQMDWDPGLVGEARAGHQPMGAIDGSLFSINIDRTITFPTVVVSTGHRMSVDSLLMDASTSGWCDNSAESFSLPPSRRLSQVLPGKRPAVRLEVRFSM